MIVIRAKKRSFLLTGLSLKASYIVRKSELVFPGKRTNRYTTLTPQIHFHNGQINVSSQKPSHAGFLLVVVVRKHFLSLSLDTFIISLGSSGVSTIGGTIERRTY